MILVVEAFRNICGATLLKDGYSDYEEFNLKKFQTTNCTNSSISNLTSFKATAAQGKKDETSHYRPTDEKETEVETELTPTSSSSLPISLSHDEREDTTHATQDRKSVV